jgi:glutaredoxin
MSILDRIRRRVLGGAAATPPRPRAPAPTAPTAPAPAVPRVDGAPRELVLYKFDRCPYCRRVMRHIDTLGVQVEYRDTRQSSTWQADLFEKTGRTTVPCLFVDGQPMYESREINDWLSSEYS